MDTDVFFGYIIFYYIFVFLYGFNSIYYYKKLLLEVSCSKSMMKKIKKKYTLKERFFLVDFKEHNKYNAKIANIVMRTHKVMIYIFFIMSTLFIISFFVQKFRVFTRNVIIIQAVILFIYVLFIYAPIYRKELKDEHFFTKKDPVIKK